MHYYPDEQQQNQSTRNNLRLTKDGVHHVMLSKSNPVVGRILPSFDFSLSRSDDHFKSSFIPYRDATRLSEQALPLFTSWFYYFPMHTYLGKSKHFYVSPRVRKSFDPSASDRQCFDPVEEMFWKIKRKDSIYTDKAFKDLVNKPQNTTEVVNLPLGTARRCAVMNFYGRVDQKSDNSNFLLVLSEMGMTAVKESLDKAGMRSQQPRDANWVDFLFGDITNPETGLEARASTKVATGNQERGIPINILSFSDSDSQLVNSRVMSVPTEVLRGRHDFFDIDRVWNIPDCQTIVDKLIDDGEIPLEFMKAVCGHYCDFPEKEAVKYTSDSTSFSAGQQKEEPRAETPDPEIPTFNNKQEFQSTSPAPTSTVNSGPPDSSAEQNPKEFAEGIDKLVEDAKLKDPSATFISVLNNDSQLILKYIQGKSVK